MQPDLPEGYYLDNVIILFEQVENLYKDIIDPQQQAFLQGFAALPENAQKLYIRLLNRSHQRFRLSKLKYPEISEIELAIQALDAAGFLRVNPAIEKQELIGLFNKSELISLHSDQLTLRKLSRVALDQFLLEQAGDEFIEQLAQSDCFLEVLQKDCYLLCQMLFFGNLNQSMTDFVLRDLGLNQYEKYAIDIDNRPYSDSLQIQQHWLLYEIDTLIQLANPDDIETLKKCFDLVPGSIEPGSSLFRKAEAIKYKIARQLERLQENEAALLFYQQCHLPPSRERIARILQKQGDIDEALSLCQTIATEPRNEEENQFALSFGRRLAKSQANNQQSFQNFTKPDKKPEATQLELHQQESVELAVADYFLARQPGNQCYFVENSLFNGVLGLLIWDVVFAPVPGAFYNPFQYRPADFYAQDFLHKRNELIENIWSSVSTSDDIWHQVSSRWESKYGLMNPLVNWQALNLEIIQLALQRIPLSHWMNIFKRILFDLRYNRAGFPDLILFPANGEYELIEVKGPGDSLQKNQQRWMRFFAEQEIPHSVAWVSWCVD